MRVDDARNVGKMLTISISSLRESMRVCGGQRVRGKGEGEKRDRKEKGVQGRGNGRKVASPEDLIRLRI